MFPVGGKDKAKKRWHTEITDQKTREMRKMHI